MRIPRQPRTRSAPPRTPPAHPHAWETLAVGRVCLACRAVQEKGSFDDSQECPERSRSA